MSHKVALKVINIGKFYKIYKSPNDRMLDLMFNRVSRKVFWAVRNVNLEIIPGESLGILGRNGSGKSTLLQILSGLLSPSEGAMEINGSVNALLELGSGFNPDFTGRENVRLYATILGMGRSELENLLEKIIEFSGIAEFIDRPLKTYSSGMAMRLAFSTVAHINTDILIVDEALSVGDAAFQAKCMDKVRELKAQGKTFILVSHGIEQILSFCDRAVVMESGRIIYDGKPREAANIYKAIMFPASRDEIIRRVESAKVLSPMPKEIPANKKSPKNTNEFRYGNGLAAVSKIVIVRKDTREQSLVFYSGEEAEILLYIDSKINIVNPVYGIRVRNKLGNTIYVKNSLDSRYQPHDLKASESSIIRIPLVFNLGSGDYLLSGSVVQFIGNQKIVIDRRIDAVNFTILKTDDSGGVANLNANFLDA